ncbi:hypothetical protein Aple_097120 [Acrocarpospora pleiomorpha]|uniref:HTH gntR-type domain-containing protein n=1 Tax=Acrocarpospora pleiomorpha TaxID=90975 RepID=A0A5M3Y402_9ACTN|nr:GntR family transcriptional regulator [Acrocarpospora pleiomorpha]GES26813.1 hypothetical protein Aple_097120 [Acrocarpospora pleiomorpha]
MAEIKARERSGPVDPTAVLLGSIELPGQESATSGACDYVRGLLVGRFDDRLRYAVLLVSELVSNALRHSDSGQDPDGKITVQVADADGFLHISVLDQGSASSVPYLVPDFGGGRGSGFGLRIVAEFASEWGHEYYGEGCRLVWFDLAPPLEAGQDGRPGKPPTWVEIMQQRAAGSAPHSADAEHIDEGGEIASPPERAGGPRRSVQAVRCAEIAKGLAGRIGSGELVGVAATATLRELMREYDLSRWQAMRVQHMLRDRGIIHLVPGQGYMAGAPGPGPVTPRPAVEEQLVHVATVLAKKIRTGRIGPHERVATCPQLMLEYGISRWTAGRALSRLTDKGYAYNAHRRGTRAATFDRWPPPSTSMEQTPPPDDHVPA